MTGEAENSKPRAGGSRAARALARFASSPALGLFLLGLLFIYLALGSLLPPPVVAALLGNSGPYAAWPLKALLAAVLVNILCASIFRIPFRLARLGGHLAHLGVLVLAGGAAWYVAHSVSGYAVAYRHPITGLFQPVDHFYLEGTAAIHVSPHLPEWDVPAELPLAGLSPTKPAAGLGEPVVSSLFKVTDYLPAAEIEWQWRDDGPSESPAVEVVIHDGPHAFRRTLCPDCAFAGEFDAGVYSVRPAARLQDDQAAKAAKEAGKDIAWIIVPRAGEAELAAYRPDGSREKRRLRAGEGVSLKLAGREVKVEAVKFLAAAWRAGVARPMAAGQAPPAVKLDISFDGWRGSHWVGYYPSVRPIEPENPQLPSLPLPEGRKVYFQFAPQSRAISQPFSIAQLRYLTYPGSGIPKDYICSLAVLGPAGQPLEELDCRLNRPADLGALRLYQGEWWPDAESPQEVVFLVAVRPGLWAVWLGCVLLCIGIPYAFYVKPLLLRRAAGREAA